jgi:hypothetical protein
MKMMVLTIIIVIGLFIVICGAMQLYTNSIMREIRSAFYCTDFYVEKHMYNPEKYPELYADPNVNYVIYEYNPENPNIFAHYNITSHSEKTMHLDEVNIDLKLHRLSTWHNFNTGALWLKYSLTVTDKNKEIITGSWNVPVKLAIDRIDGKWVITGLYEAL